MSSMASNHRVSKRNRVPLSCAPCRVRKLKCNREQPCQNCIARDASNICSYANGAEPLSGNGHARTEPRSARPRPDGMQNRIDRLEDLVAALISETRPPTSSDDSVTPDRSSSEREYSRSEKGSEGRGELSFEKNLEMTRERLGVMIVDKEQSVYRGTTHWDDIVHELAALRSTWNNYVEGSEPRYLDISESLSPPSPKLLRDSVSGASRAGLLTSFPAKSVADKLIARFFDKFDPVVPALPLVHQPTFMKEYTKHWDNPQHTRIIFIALMYTMLCSTMQSYSGDPEEPPEYSGVSQSLADMYRSRSRQCMEMVDISQSAPYTLETMVLQAIGEFKTPRSGEVGAWYSFGMIVRAAMRMGFHRDGSIFPNISPFEVEMRRRAWAFVYQVDAMLSFHIGLPNMVRGVDSDTRPPGNLFDEDMTEDMTAIPSSRPMTEPTPMLYMLQKNRILVVIGGIVEYFSSLKAHEYNCVLRLDEALLRVYEDFPVSLKARDWDTATSDPVALIMQRVQLDFLYLRAMCTLHRQFLAQAQTDPRYALSGQRCIDSALKLLKHQADLYEQTKPSGRIRSFRWWALSTTSSDITLAAMVLCLELQHDRQQRGGRTPKPYNDRRREVLQSLESASRIWDEAQDESEDAQKISRVLKIMLNKVEPGAGSHKHSLSPLQLQSASQWNGLPLPRTLASSSIVGAASGESWPLGNSTDSSGAYDTPLDIMQVEKGGVNLDWDTWDSFFNDTSLENSYPACFPDTSNSARPMNLH